MLTRPATIMRSAWRGDARNTSAPKREMSKRGPTIAIISIAQQARPNPSGQIAFARAQFTTFSTLVKRMPRSSSSRIESSSLFAGSSDGGRGGSASVRNGFFSSVMSSPQLRPRHKLPLARRSLPLQGPLLQQVDVAHEQDQDEEQHLDQAVRSELLECDRPRVEEHRLDVEQDEQHGHEIELHGEARARVSDRLDPALVRGVLHGIGPAGHDDRGERDRARAEPDRHDQEQQDWQVLSHRSSPRSDRLPPSAPYQPGAGLRNGTRVPSAARLVQLPHRP